MRAFCCTIYRYYSAKVKRNYFNHAGLSLRSYKVPYLRGWTMCSVFFLRELFLVLTTSVIVSTFAHGSNEWVGAESHNWLDCGNAHGVACNGIHGNRLPRNSHVVRRVIYSKLRTSNILPTNILWLCDVRERQVETKVTSLLRLFFVSKTVENNSYSFLLRHPLLQLTR